MGWEIWLAGFVAGLVIATVTTPVGVSGAVFLLPVQLDLLGVPSPAVTPTNLLFNVVAAPGALLRYRSQGQITGPLTMVMIIGTLPGVVIGSIVRVYLVPDVQTFRLVAAAVLLPMGVWLCGRTLRGPHVRGSAQPPVWGISGLALVVGVVGGIYGIGGGSILAPILVGRGMAVATVAPAALASTFVTSIVGACTYAVLATRTADAIGPDWILGCACGLGGLIGGILGARWQRRLPETALKLLLGGLATAVALVYLAAWSP